jgi:hypothetical protein
MGQDGGFITVSDTLIERGVTVIEGGVTAACWYDECWGPELTLAPTGDSRQLREP